MSNPHTRHSLMSRLTILLIKPTLQDSSKLPSGGYNTKLQNTYQQEAERKDMGNSPLSLMQGKVTISDLSSFLGLTNKLLYLKMMLFAAVSLISRGRQKCHLWSAGWCEISKSRQICTHIHIYVTVLTPCKLRRLIYV